MKLLFKTTQRELLEETGLQADYKICGLYHEIVYQEDNKDLIEDKMFFVIHCTNPTGELKEDFEGGVNKWLSKQETLKLGKVFSSIDDKYDIIDGQKTYVEFRSKYKKEDF